MNMHVSFLFFILNTNLCDKWRLNQFDADRKSTRQLSLPLCLHENKGLPTYAQDISNMTEGMRAQHLFCQSCPRGSSELGLLSSRVRQTGYEVGLRCRFFGRLWIGDVQSSGVGQTSYSH
jgi:hypothetical protein